MICITVVFAIALASHGASFRIGPALPRDLMVLRGSDHPDTGKQCSDDQLLMILPQLSHGCPVVPNFYENPPCPFPLPLPQQCIDETVRKNCKLVIDLPLDFFSFETCGLYP